MPRPLDHIKTSNRTQRNGGAENVRLFSAPLPLPASVAVPLYRSASSSPQRLEPLATGDVVEALDQGHELAAVRVGAGGGAGQAAR